MLSAAPESPSAPVAAAPTAMLLAPGLAWLMVAASAVLMAPMTEYEWAASSEQASEPTLELVWDRMLGTATVQLSEARSATDSANSTVPLSGSSSSAQRSAAPELQWGQVEAARRVTQMACLSAQRSAPPTVKNAEPTWAPMTAPTSAHLSEQERALPW